MIIEAVDPDDLRLDAFRWRERQLANRSHRAENVGAGLFIAEGDLVVERALKAGCAPVTVLCERDLAQHFDVACGGGIEVFVGSSELRKHVTGLGVPLDVVALFRRPTLRKPSEVLAGANRILVLEEIDNPTNVGAIIRSAAGLGWDGVLLDATSADPLARRALRVSMGTALSLPFARFEAGTDIASFVRDRGCETIGLSPDPHAIDIATATVARDRLAVFFGSERSGLSSSTMSVLDHLVRIPMHSGVDSLNVGAAAAIALFAFGRRG